MNMVVVEFLESGHLEGSEETLRLEQHLRRSFTTMTKSFVLLGKFDLILLVVDRMLPRLLQKCDLAVGEVHRHGVVGCGGTERRRWEGAEDADQRSAMANGRKGLRRGYCTMRGADWLGWRRCFWGTG